MITPTDNSIKTKLYNNKTKTNNNMWGAIIGAATSAVAALASSISNRRFQKKTMREQNEFNSNEAQITREWNQQMDNTKYQRQVADMQAAGVNPALAMSGGVATQATSNATASSGSGIPGGLDLSSVMQMAVQMQQLKLQKKLTDAQIKSMNADFRLKNAEAEGTEIDNQYKDEFNSLRNEGQKLLNDLTVEQKNEVLERIKKISSEVDLLKKQAATEEERKNLVIAETALKKAMADKTDAEKQRIIELVPFEKALFSAQTENQKAQAAYSLIQAAYQQKLIDSGYIDSMVRENNANASKAEQEALARQIENQLKTGNFYPDKGFINKAANMLLAGATGLAHVVSAISPFSGFGKVQ